MKSDFKSITNQACYISRFIERKTDIEKKCVVCGKPAIIQHNRVDPYKVRFLCRECRTKYKVGNHTVDETPWIDDLPIIDLAECMIRPFVISKYTNITEEQKRIIDEAIKNKWTRKETVARLKTHHKGLNDLLEKYNKLNPGKISEFKKSTKEGQRSTILKSSLNRIKSDKFNTKILELKLAKQMSTDDMVKKINHRISANTINLIIEGKLEPSERFKKLIAKALDTDVEKIF